MGFCIRFTLQVRVVDLGDAMRLTGFIAFLARGRRLGGGVGSEGYGTEHQCGQPKFVHV